MMNEIRQSVWTKKEDTLLANTVLRYIQEGKTQLDAFADVAAKLSRTAAACGFRWNATLRKQYSEEIDRAKTFRGKPPKNNSSQQTNLPHALMNIHEQIHTAISLLETLKGSATPFTIQNDPKKVIEQLQAENDRLQKKLLRYEQAWQEMQKIGEWVFVEED